jgi:hypothetical protein
VNVVCCYLPAQSGHAPKAHASEKKCRSGSRLERACVPEVYLPTKI